MKILSCNIPDHIKAQTDRHSRPDVQQLTADPSRCALRQSLWDLVFVPHFSRAKSVLCLGARHDSEVLFFEDKDLSAYGVDLSVETDYIVKLDCHDLSSEFVHDEYDVIFASHVLEHCHDAKGVLSQIRYVGAMGAVVVLPTTRNGCRQSLQHPTIFDVMVHPVDEIEDPGLLEDFSDLKPYKNFQYNRFNGEVALSFIF